jgi:ABC-type uncharacterized transport system substrate-binding protein
VHSQKKLAFTGKGLTFAHPHIFIDLSVTHDAKETCLHIQRLVDEASSELIKLDYDTNHNNRFEPQETKAMLSEEGYGMFFYRDDFFLYPERSVNHLDATIIDGRVSITFDTDATFDL